MLEPLVMPPSPVVDVAAAVPVEPSALRSPDNPEPDEVDDVDEAGDARLCSNWEISPGSDACELPAAVPAAWVTAALCTADPAGLVVCGAEVNGVTWLAAAEFAA
jgi:hypothetical protein